MPIKLKSCGYWLIYNNDTDPEEFDIIGIKTNCSVISYDLHYGYNLISYPGPDLMSIEIAIPLEFLDHIRAIIGEGISAINTDNGWQGSLVNLKQDDGYWIFVDEQIDEFYFECDEDLARGYVSAPAVSSHLPEGFSYKQSMAQSFYFIEDVVIDGEPISIDDWLIAYYDNTVIGARQWSGKITDVPAMGNDGFEITNSYIETGSTPKFKLLREGQLIDLEGDIPTWSNNGVFIVPSLKTATTLPESFSLESAYPNPFNPVTTLNFAMPVDSKVSLSIYDLQGREVISLIDGNMDAG